MCFDYENGYKTKKIRNGGYMNINKDYIIYLNLDENLKIKKKQNIKLLTEQLFWLNRNDVKVFKSSKNLYDKYKNKNLNENIIKRCCNFPLPIKKCKKYNDIEQKV